jgi:hypothetical protein
LAYFHQSHGLKGRTGLADGDPADAEAIAEHGLARQWGARGELADHDPFGQIAYHRGRQPLRSARPPWQLRSARGLVGGRGWVGRQRPLLQSIWC